MAEDLASYEVLAALLGLGLVAGQHMPQVGMTTSPNITQG